MKKLRWYFKNGTKFEDYSVLYSDDKFILVQNDNTKEYSFGLVRDFGTLFGFPVNQSCLQADEAKEQLTAFIKIDESYIDTLGDIAKVNIERWKNMLEVITI
jgi:hypothetical protein